MAAPLAERGFIVDGIDISPAAIAWANERSSPPGRFMVGDVVQQPILGPYDVILAGHCLHCMVGADRARVLANVRDALAPGGSFIVPTMCGEVTIPALLACFDPVSRCQVVEGVAYRYIGEPEAILGELRAAGLAITASMVRERENEDDQEHLWAVATV